MSLLLKPVYSYNKLSLIEEAEDAEDVTALLHANLVEAFRFRKMLQLDFRNHLNLFDQF